MYKLHYDTCKIVKYLLLRTLYYAIYPINESVTLIWSDMNFFLLIILDGKT